MKVCVIGACGHVHQALSYLKIRKDVVLCGFAPGSARENRTASLDPAMPFYEDYRVMLEEIRPDLAVVSPIFGLTGKIIQECANRGIDVFAEKPVASSFEELEEVRQAVEKGGSRFCAMHYLRYTPAFYHAAKMVKDGKIGKVQMITAQKSYRFGTRPEWYGDRSLYGGTIPWVGIHAMDWIAHFSGKKFISVTARSLGESPEMAALCQFELEDNVIAAANIDYYRPATAPTHGDDRVRCVGTEGVIEVCGGKISLMCKDGVFEFCPDSAPELLEEFLDGGEAVTPQEIFHITKAAIAAREAADRQTEIQIGE